MPQLITILNLLDSATTKLYIETSEMVVLGIDLTDETSRKRLDEYKTGYVISIAPTAKNELSIKLK